MGADTKAELWPGGGPLTAGFAICPSCQSWGLKSWGNEAVGVKQAPCPAWLVKEASMPRCSRCSRCTRCMRCMQCPAMKPGVAGCKPCNVQRRLPAAAVGSLGERRFIFCAVARREERGRSPGASDESQALSSPLAHALGKVGAGDAPGRPPGPHARPLTHPAKHSRWQSGHG